MSLNFKEKRALQKIISEQLTTLRGGTLNFKEKRQAQKAMREALAKLGGEAEAGDDITLTRQAARGDFNGLRLPEFIEKLKEAYSADEDLEGAKEAAVGYLEANQDELEAA